MKRSDSSIRVRGIFGEISSATLLSPTKRSLYFQTKPFRISWNPEKTAAYRVCHPHLMPLCLSCFSPTFLWRSPATRDIKKLVKNGVSIVFRCWNLTKRASTVPLRPLPPANFWVWGVRDVWRKSAKTNKIQTGGRGCKKTHTILMRIKEEFISKISRWILPRDLARDWVNASKKWGTFFWDFT